MNDTTDSSPSWFEKLSRLLTREPKSQTQLVDILREAQQRQLIDVDALEMIEAVLEVSDRQVRDIMIPRPQMIVVDSDSTPEAAVPLIIKSRHSRFPVIGESRDKILGVLLAKDLLPFMTDQKSHNNRIRDLTRPAIFIPESKRLDVLLKEFRLNRNHMAIVVDEYGGVAGLVTIEDVLEQIVGNIEDEYDVAQKEPYIKKLEKDEYLVKALTPIDEFNAYFKCDFSDEDYDTIGGLVLQKFGHLPKRNEVTELNKFQVIVVKATRRGIQLLRLKQLKNEI